MKKFWGKIGPIGRLCTAGVAVVLALAGSLILLGEYQRRTQVLTVADVTEAQSFPIKAAWGGTGTILRLEVVGQLEGSASLDVENYRQNDPQKFGPGTVKQSITFYTDGQADAILRYTPQKVQSGEVTIHYMWDGS